MQHLVREHKIAEPRQRTRAANKDAPTTGDQGEMDDVSYFADR